MGSRRPWGCNRELRRRLPRTDSARGPRACARGSRAGRNRATQGAPARRGVRRSTCRSPRGAVPTGGVPAVYSSGSSQRRRRRRAVACLPCHIGCLPAVEQPQRPRAASSPGRRDRGSGRCAVPASCRWRHRQSVSPRKPVHSSRWPCPQDLNGCQR